jgi:hypothetical protein
LEEKPYMVACRWNSGGRAIGDALLVQIRTVFRQLSEKEPGVDGFLGIADRIHSCGFSEIKPQPRQFWPLAVCYWLNTLFKKGEYPINESQKLKANSQKQKKCTFAASIIGNNIISN